MKLRFFVAMITLLAILIPVASSAPIQNQPMPFQLKQFNMILLLPAGNLDAKQKAAHTAYIKDLAASNKAILVGEISGQGPYSGVIVVDEQSKDKVKQVADDDPAVKSGAFKADVLAWFTDQNAFGMGQAESPIKLTNYYFGMIKIGPKFSS